MARFFLLLLLAFLLGGCRTVIEATYPGGEPKVVRTYGLAGLWGRRDSTTLRRERTFHFNGKPERDAHFLRGKLHGTYQDFWHNGQRRSRGEYVDGLRQGIWEYYFNEYSLAQKGAYQDDLKEGPWVELWENGDLRAEGEYRNGRETGTWKRYAAGGDLVEETSCFEANAEGRRRTYHAERTPKEDYACERGMPAGPYEKRNVEGGVEERGTFGPGGKKEGLWETFHPDGTPASRRTYRGGVEVDSLLVLDAAGRVRERGFLPDGKGEILVHDSLGRLVESRGMVDGRPEGEVLTFYPDGKKRSLIVHVDGRPTSMRKWHPDGRVAAEGAFRGGKRHGEWRQWGPDGRLLDLSRYVDGFLHGDREMYDSSGALMRVQRYERGYPAEGRFPGGVKPTYGAKRERSPNSK